MSNDSIPASREHILFVTGQLAQSAVQSTVSSLADKIGFDFSIVALPITVAALMTPKWLLRKLTVPAGVTRIIVPGHLESGLNELRSGLSVQVDCGPRDIRNLSEFFGKKRESAADLTEYSIEILAEINHAPAYSMDQLISRAIQLREQGADIIDLGCTPGVTWHNVGDAVSALRERQIRVSIDSFDADEVAQACRAGAELVLSVNSTNCRSALDWGAEVVVVPDVPNEEKNFFETIEFLVARGVKVRLDPILEPIGCGLARSLQRYAQVRSRYAELPMMMGIGNLTELTDVDSAGINMLLLGICQELSIQSVLTTNVINWARTSVQECDIARRLVHYAVKHSVPPKRLDDRLVMLRDGKVNRYTSEVIEDLAESIRDSNVRLLAQDGVIHFLAAGYHFQGADPMAIFNEVLDSPLGPRLDASHAFYLGYEMCKALTALTLDKQYEQDEALRWGYLTRYEKSHRLARRKSADQ
ncbi:MAG: dihydropteroate synthase [Pirellulaceae bacterium]|nr:dihydropteroate synthase [Pirellulaceae bacterium]